MSGEKNAMSPFEKRLAEYQKSADMRARSGSRGRPVAAMNNTGSNFYMNP